MFVNKSTLQTAFIAIVAVTLWDFAKSKIPAIDPASYIKA